MPLKYKNFIANSITSSINNDSKEDPIKIENLEKVINLWLNKNRGIEVVQMTHSTMYIQPDLGDYKIMISILYKER